MQSLRRVVSLVVVASALSAALWVALFDSAAKPLFGTNYLVVRDCVGYRSIGHGFFLEDGTEVNSVLDRNLAVRAGAGKPLTGQALPFDRNDGASTRLPATSLATTSSTAIGATRRKRAASI